jgi:PAS domain-containing protein
LNREVRSLAKNWEVDLVNESVFWSDEVHQLHDTDVKSFIPDFKGAMNFYRQIFTTVKTILLHVFRPDNNAILKPLITTKKQRRWVRAIGNAEFINGKCKRIYGSFQDINERKEAEVRLQS